MATKPMALQEQGSVNSPDEWVNEAWAHDEVGAIMSHNSPLQDKKAPRAQPEEDVDVLEPGAPDGSLPENQILSRAELVDASKLEDQESTRICPCTPRDTQDVTELEQVCKKLSEGSQTQEESEKPADVCEDVFPPPPPPLSALSTDERFEREGFSNLEGNVAERISDVEVPSDTAEALISPDKEWAQTTQLTEPVDQEVDSTSDEMTEDTMAAEENDTQLHFLPDGFDNSECEYNTSRAAHQSPSDSNNSDAVYTVCSPPFADGSEEKEEVSMDITSCQQQLGKLDIKCEPLQPSYSADVSVLYEKDPTSALPAVPSAEHQDELLPQGQCGLAPKGANQEAAQQVQGQGSPPLSNVAMEPSDRGGAASQDFGCVVSMTERHSKAGGRTEGEGERTGREGGQEEGGLERNKEHGRGLLRYSETGQIQVLKTGKDSCGMSFKHSNHNSMESDSCDDSQSDSGVSADFSPCSTLEGNTTISTGSPASVPKETPIEREIRRAIEREHSLRRSRGLPNPPTSPEYVDIPLRKTVLCQSFTSKSERCQGKDRQFAGKKMQHEIQEEAQREEDLVKLGKVPGFYDKGTVRQLKERKQLFEAFQKPNGSTLTVSTRSKTASSFSSSDISNLENQEDISSQTTTIGGLNVKMRRSVDLLSLTESPSSSKGGELTTSTPRGPGLSEGTGLQVIILESNLSVPAQKLYHAKRETEPFTTVDSGGPNISSSRMGGHGGINGKEQETEEEEEEEVELKENPFFKLRASTNLVKVEQDIRETRERERALRKQRINLYGETGVAKGGEGRGGRPASIEGKSPSSSRSGPAVPDLRGSSPRRGTGPSAAHKTVGKCSIWPPAQAEEESTTQPEVPWSPQTARQKTPLVQRWESGLDNGYNQENDRGGTDREN